MSPQEATDGRVLAAIDVGSNSIKMLAAEVTAAGLVYLGQDLVTVRLQSGLEGGLLGADAMRRGAEAVALLAAEARGLGAREISAFGTSALRDAGNAGEFAAMVRGTCGVELRVISGEEEAQSSYLAVSPPGRALVVNPGGGSTEMTLGLDGRALRARSAHIGAISLQRRAGGAPAGDVLALARELLLPVWEDLEAVPGLPVVASGGAASCAAAVYLGCEEEADGCVLRADEGLRLLERLWAMPVEERRALPGMQPQRADILPYGLAILLAFLECAGSGAMRISTRGNLYGFVRMMAEGF